MWGAAFPDRGYERDQPPDFGLYLDRGQSVEVGCLGGHGRTGTALACLAVLAGLGEDPVRWIRARYCQHAVETDEQANFASSFDLVE